MSYNVKYRGRVCFTKKVILKHELEGDEKMSHVEIGVSMLTEGMTEQRS
jgi:hypothetical protein